MSVHVSTTGEAKLHQGATDLSGVSIADEIQPSAPNGISPQQISEQIQNNASCNRSIDYATQYEALKAAALRCGRGLPTDNPLYQKVQEALRCVCKGFQLHVDSFQLVVAVDPTPNAYIVRHPLLNESLIVVNTGYLHDLQRHFGSLKFGHLVFSLGHEVGHFIKGHYDSFHTTPLRTGTDGFLTIHDDTTRRKFQSLAQEISERAFTRNQELEVDRLGFDALLNQRLNLLEGVEVLEYLTHTAQSDPQRKLDVSGTEFPALSLVVDASNVMTRTHPASLERENAGRAYVRERNTAVDLQTGKPWSELTCASEEIGDLLSDRTKSTPLQDVIRELSRCDIAKLSRSKTLANTVTSILDSYETSPNYNEILSHAWLYTVTALQIKSGIPPLVPFGWLKGFTVDDKKFSLFDNNSASDRPELKQLETAIIERIRSFSEKEGLDEKIEVFFRLQGMFYSRDAGRLWAINIVAKGAADPRTFFEQINQMGQIKFDFSRESMSELMGLVSSEHHSAVARRARQVTSVLHAGDLDIRWPCIAEALQEQLLSKIDSPEEFLSAVVGIEKILRDARMGRPNNDARSFGEEVGLWVIEQLDGQEEAIKKFFSALVNRETVTTDPSGEIRSFDVLAMQALADVTYHFFDKSPQSAVSFLVSALPNPSNTRDLVLMELAKRYDKTPGVRDADLCILPYLTLEDAQPCLIRHSRSSLVLTNLSRQQKRKLRKLGMLDSSSDSSEIVSTRKQSALAVFDKVSQYEISVPNTPYGSFVKEFLEQREFRGDTLTFALCSPLAAPLLASPSFRNKTKRELRADERLVILEYLRSERGTLARHVEMVDEWISGRDAVLVGRQVGYDPVQYFAALPSGELKDFLLLKALHGTIAKPKSHLTLAMLFGEQQLKGILSGIPRGKDEQALRTAKLVRFVLKQLSFVGTSSERSVAQYQSEAWLLHKGALVARIFKDEKLFVELSNGIIDLSEIPQENFFLPTAHSIGAEYGAYAFSLRYPQGISELPLRPAEAIYTILAYFPFASSHRDHRLLQLFEREIASNPDFAKTREALKIFDLIDQELSKSAMGRRIYKASLKDAPDILNSFDDHLELLLRTHPPGTVSRSEAIRDFCNGTAATPPSVTTWDHHRRLRERLQAPLSDQDRRKNFISSSSFSVLKSMLVDSAHAIDEAEKVDTLLWALGERDKSKLVKCLELVENRPIEPLTSANLSLTYAEKKALLTAVLGGPGGILRGTPDSKRRFLDHLFSSFLASTESFSQDERRGIKAAFDTIMHYLDPERASEHLTTLLLSHVEKRDFAELVRVGFGSIPVWGARSGQYLVTQTSTLSERPELAKELLSLTSRVPNSFSKTQLFDLLSLQFGDLAPQLVPEIHEVLGDGATATVYRVSVRSEDGLRDVALAVLRPETLRDLPVDGQAMYSLVRSVEAAPELFNGVALNERMFTSVQQGLALDVDRPRCIRIQRALSEQLERFNQAQPGAVVSTPKVIDTLPVVTAEGAQEIPVSIGAFLFMELAEGENLDQLLSDDALTDAQKRDLLEAVGTRLSELMLYQLGQSEIVGTAAPVLHCDLHPGNIRIVQPRVAGDDISVCLLDLPVSVEVSRELSHLCGEIVSLAVRADTSSSSGVEKMIRLFKGYGTPTRKEAELNIVRALDLFAVLRPESQLSRSVQAIAADVCDILYDTTRPLQQRLGMALSCIQDSGLPIPEQLSTLLRGVAVSQYLYDATDWKRLSPLIDQVLKQRAESFSITALDKKMVSAKLVLLGERLGAPITIQRARAWANGTEKVLDPIRRVSELIERFSKHMQDSATGRTSSNGTKILDEIMKDTSLLALLIGDASAAAVRDVRCAIQSQQDSAWLSHYMRIVPISLEDAQREGIEHAFGFSPLCWRRRLMEGTWVSGINKRSDEKKHYLVAGYDQEEPRFVEIDAPDEEFEKILKRIWNPKSKLTSSELRQVTQIISKATPGNTLDFFDLKRRLRDINIRDNEAARPRWVGITSVVHDFGHTKKRFYQDVERTRKRLAGEGADDSPDSSPTATE